MEVAIKRRETTDAIIVHCSLTFPTQHVDRAVITGWHRAQGWSDIGYHLIIRRDGGVEFGRQLDRVGAHCLGRNASSVGIVLAGGLDTIPNTGPVNEAFVISLNGKKVQVSANYTTPQWAALASTIAWLRSLYGIPTANIMGHRDAVADKRPCPAFNVSEWIRSGKASAPTSLEQ